MVRSADSLLPQIAHDLTVTIGAASIAVWAYSLVHGSMQLVIGPIGDRFGKYRIVALACAGAAVFVALCGLTQNLVTLTLARIASAAFAAWIIPMGMAYIGDVVPYDRRQPVLARYAGQSLAAAGHRHCVRGIRPDVRRICLCGCRPFCALWTELHADRTRHRHVRDRRIAIRRLRPCAGRTVRASRPRASGRARAGLRLPRARGGAR